jgi:hypothetical protein
LAIHKKLTLSERLFLLKLLAERKQQPNAFFGQIHQYSTAKAAVFAVQKEEAHCVVLGAIGYSQIVANHPGIKLEALLWSIELPEVAIVGNKSLFEQRDKGLWTRLQQTMVNSHQDPHGDECFEFWTVQRLMKPNNHFEKLTRVCLTDYPIDLLRDLPTIPSTRVHP